MKLTPSRALAVSAGLVIIALTGAAFWLSYAHLAEVALAHGLGQATERAWAWPATLDLFIVAGELLMLRAALKRQVDGWAIALTAVGSLGSIVLNVAGVTGNRDPGEVPLLDYVVAAVPPTAALFAFGALMRQIHQALAEREVPAEPQGVQPEEAPSVVIERVVEPPEVVPAGVQLLPLTARPEPTTGGEEPKPRALPEVVPSGVRLLPMTARPEPVEVTTVPAQDERPRERPLHRLDHLARRYVPVETPDKVVAPTLPEMGFHPIVWPAPKAAAVPAEQPRQVVTEQVTITPVELRRRARTLHRKVVREGGRAVTVDQLRDAFGLSRREATALRREVVTEPAGANQ
ncbi:DUF2637 domain-containing protein [Streptomyces sp. SBC-4]|nr:DUF2637 domain-containing protein [Streptomyces sp. SBC-4]MDV5147199.1 DUF2637 domain-containing protein [Streptomyces sp. SBC-4]